MPRFGGFYTGVVVGVVAVYVVHHWVMPMPGPNTAAKRSGS
jgi:hypothetical protein